MDNSFLNLEFNANNVFKLNFPLTWFNGVKAALNNTEIFSRLIKVQPKWNSDIGWHSPNTLHDFKLFNDIFVAFNVEKVVREGLKLDFNLVVYCGFLVVRSRCDDVNFHTDWVGTGQKAFTLITPLVEEGEDFGLLFKRADSSIGKYFYKPGEAIVFSEGFIHSSMPTSSDRRVVLLSYTFGSDDMDLWPYLSKTIGYQSNIIRLPNGDFRIISLDKCAQVG